MKINWTWPEETKAAALAYAQKVNSRVVDVQGAGTGLWFWGLLVNGEWVKILGRG